MDGMTVPPVRVPVDVPHDSPVVILTGSPNDGLEEGLSIGMVDA